MGDNNYETILAHLKMNVVWKLMAISAAKGRFAHSLQWYSVVSETPLKVLSPAI